MASLSKFRFHVSLRSIILIVIIAIAFNLAAAWAWPAFTPYRAPAILENVFTVAILVLIISPFFRWFLNGLRIGSLQAADFTMSRPALLLLIVLATVICSFTTRGIMTSFPMFLIALGVNIVAGHYIFRRTDGMPMWAFLAGAVAFTLAIIAALSNMHFITSTLHEAHVRHYFSAMSVENVRVIAYSASLFLGIVVGAVSWRITMKSSSRIGAANASATNARPADSPYVGFHTQTKNDELERKRQEVRDLEREAAVAAEGDATEGKMLALLSELQSEGWTVQANLFLEGVRIGDVDALVTAPSGRKFAIDAKQRRGGTVVINPTTDDITITRKDGSRKDTDMLEKALYQAKILKQHGYGDVVPMFCFFEAVLNCPAHHRNVWIVDSSDLVLTLRRIA